MATSLLMNDTFMIKGIYISNDYGAYVQCEQIYKFLLLFVNYFLTKKINLQINFLCYYCWCNENDLSFLAFSFTFFLGKRK